MHTIIQNRSKEKAYIALIPNVIDIHTDLNMRMNLNDIFKSNSTSVSSPIADQTRISASTNPKSALFL